MHTPSVLCPHGLVGGGWRNCLETVVEKKRSNLPLRSLRKKKKTHIHESLLFCLPMMGGGRSDFQRPTTRLLIYMPPTVPAIKHLPSSICSSDVQNVRIFFFIPDKLAVPTCTTAVKWQFYCSLVGATRWPLFISHGSLHQSPMFTHGHRSSSCSLVSAVTEEKKTST